MPLYPPAGSGGGAPTDAVYITGGTHADLSAERVVTDTATLAWDQGTAAQLKANVLGLPTVVRLTGDVTMPSTSASYSDVTGFSFTPAADKDYLFEFFILYTGDTAGVGADFSVNGPTSPTSISFLVRTPTSNTVVTQSGAVAYDTSNSSTATIAGTNLANLVGIIRNGSTSSALILRHRLETGTTAVNVVKIGSILRYWLLN